MSRALAVLILELRLEARYRLYAVGGVLAIGWTGLLLALPAPAARLLTPMLLFVDTATVGVFLLAAMVLFERSERSLSAILVTPVRTMEYMGAKVAALTGLALVIAVPVAAAGSRLVLRPAPVLAGVTLTAVFLLLCAFALVARHRTITAFLSIAPWPMIPLMAVPLAWLLGLVDHPVVFIVPTVPGAALIAKGFTDGLHVPAAAVAYQLVWTVGVGAVAVRRFTTAVRAAGG